MGHMSLKLGSGRILGRIYFAYPGSLFVLQATAFFTEKSCYLHFGHVYRAK